MSRTRTIAVPSFSVRTMMLSNSSGFWRRPERRIDRSFRSSVTRPTGAARFCDWSAATTSASPPVFSRG